MCDILKNFRFFDLFVFTLLMVVSEFLSSFLFDVLSSGFYLSFSTLLFLIVSIRWGWWALIPFVLSGIPLVLKGDYDLVLGIIYHCVVNAFAIIPILFLGKKDRNVVKKSNLALIIYILSVLISLSLGKGLVIFIHSKNIAGMYGYFVSMLFTFVVNTLLMFLFVKSKHTVR